jgi:hypothetical protein
MSESKTHYRKVFKSDHLGVADLEEFIEEGKRLVFTIKEVKSHILDSSNKNSGIVVAGRRIGANIAYFKEGIKPLVLNATNSKIVRSFNKSAFVEDWNNTIIELYIDNLVKMKGDIVGGIRIKPTQPTINKPELTPTHKSWEAAKVKVMMKEASKESIRKHWSITDENYELLCG